MYCMSINMIGVQICEVAWCFCISLMTGRCDSEGVSSICKLEERFSVLCYLQLFDADVGVEIHLQLLHLCFQLHLFLLHAGQPVFSHFGLSLLLGHLGLSKEHLPILSSSPNNDPSAAGSCL